jgi:hypothetical protein
MVGGKGGIWCALTQVMFDDVRCCSAGEERVAEIGQIYQLTTI